MAIRPESELPGRKSCEEIAGLVHSISEDMAVRMSRGEMIMPKAAWNGRKVTVVGAGAVGSTFCYTLAQSGLAEEIVLIDQNSDLVRGQVLDLNHGQLFFPSVDIHVGDKSDYRDTQLIVLTAGSKQRPGETRLDLLQRNASIIESIASDVANAGSHGVLLVVSNPVDVLTYVALKTTGWPRGRVIGSGTVLDSARFRYLLSRHCQVDTQNVHGYILGEHGDSEFAAWSMTRIGGMDIDSYCSICGFCDDCVGTRNQIEQEVRESAYHIINYKGSTCFAIGLALVRITAAILRGQKSVLSVSTLLQDEFGLSDVCLSVPCIVSENGVERIVAGHLQPEEDESLSRSAALLRQANKSLER